MTDRIVIVAFLVVALSTFGRDSAAGDDLANKIDAIIASAYATASEEFPCEVKARGKPKILRWEELDRCLNRAVNRVDWDAVSKGLQNLRAGENGRSDAEIWAAVDASLSAHALVFEKVISAKASEDVLLPLTNSLLKCLPADSLQNLPVYDRAGTQVGTFLGIYSYERTGGLASANTYSLSLFQYTDRSGNVQGVGEKLLLDAYGVPWREAKSQRGFRLPAGKLKPEK
jgi:hypothetical protein